MLLVNVMNYFTGFLTRKDGQGMVEYILIIALIALAVIATMVLLGDAIKLKFLEVVTELAPTP